MGFSVSVKRNLFLLFIILTIIQSACNRDKTFDQLLYKAIKNSVYKDVEEAKFASVLKSTLNEESASFTNPKFLLSYYQEHGFQAVLIKRFLPENKLDLLSNHLKSAAKHGLSPESFQAAQYEHLLQEIKDKERIKTVDEAYKKLARLELLTANNLLSYSNALSFGVINPTKLFKRYFMETKRPDTLSMKTVLNVGDLEGYLDSIQPSSASYKALQQALATGIIASGKSKEESSKTIKANLERLRWKHTYDAKNMVYVNIPAYSLTVVHEGKPIEKMKVIVGTGRNNSGDDTISGHTKPVEDAPHSHETPVLSSLIHSVQVNPVWNIPESIATKEILKHVQADRFYLVNNGIDVLENGKVIEDSESIDWSSVSKEDLPYRFRQRPGNENALGKIKFLFKNNSSVYLHDTPAKAAFDRKIRAASHGCVRVEKPLELAHDLFGEGEKYTTIKQDMESKTAEAKDISLDPKTTVVLDYCTIKVENGQLHFYPDVYGLDIVLYTHL